MNARPPAPLASIDNRIPEAGRIRIGVKTAKAMKSLDTFRFTSPHRDLIELLAGTYGGVAKAWVDTKANPPNQYEVITTTSSIPVLLLPNCINVWYELWAGGGRQRQCDGVTVEMAGHDTMVQAPCVCAAKARMECAPYTRITVILPELPFRGTWRLNTKGWNALRELPGMVDLVNAVAGGGIATARLGVDKRQKIENGKTSHFVVPTITMDATPLEIATGQATLRGLASATVDTAPALAAAPLPELLAATPADDDIVDAELVEVSALQERAWKCADRYSMDRAAFWRAFVYSTDGDEARIDKGITNIEQGRFEPIGYTADGGIHLVKGPTS
jgi:hypothetical protein